MKKKLVSLLTALTMLTALFYGEVSQRPRRGIET